MARNIERRAFTSKLEVRETADGGVSVRGYAAVFDSVSHQEVVRRGAFDKTLAERADVRLLVNHVGVALGRTSKDTLTVGVDERGLWFEADLDLSNPTAQEVASAMQRGDLDQCSFAFVDFTPKEQRIDDDGVRNIRQVQLYDVSLVTFPWYEDTTAELNKFAMAGAEARSAAKAPGRDLAKRVAALMPQLSRRDLNGWTFANLYPLLWDAVEDTLDDDSYWWLWLCDISDTWFVYQIETIDDTVCYQVDYTIDAQGAVTLGAPKPVIAKTVYLDDPDAVEDESDVLEASSWRLEAARFEAQHFAA